jgi:hypothetical protein
VIPHLITYLRSAVTAQLPARSSFESVIESFHKSEKSDPLKNGTLEKLSSKLLDKGASRRQIGKAPAIMDFAPSNNSSSMSRLDVSQLMKLL